MARCVISIRFRRSVVFTLFMISIGFVVFFILGLIDDIIKLVHQVFMLIIRFLGKAKRKDALNTL